MPIYPYNNYDVVSTSVTYQDLRHLADDKTVLENPHKGWYYHFLDNGYGRPAYRDRLVEGKKLQTPCLNHMYLRFDWGDIEKEEGILDWSYIDEVFEKWGALGYKFTLRICTFEGANITYATPKWLVDRGIGATHVVPNTPVSSDPNATKEDLKKGAYEPDYGNPLYLKKLELFLAACGKKFNCDPQVEYLDIGTFGTWGEGHTWSGTGKAYSADVIKQHINLHLKYFPDKTLMINDDFIAHVARTSAEDASALYDYCLNKGLGIRDDSICVQSFSDRFGYDTLRLPTVFANFAKYAPVDIEFAHIHHNADHLMKDGYPIIEALRHAHATYAGYHGYEDDWYAKVPYLSDYCANRLGYWFFVDGIDMGTPCSGCSEIGKIYIRNNGFSKCYHQYDLKLRLQDNSGNTYPLNDQYPDSTRWLPEQNTEEVFRLNYRNVPPGEYAVEVGLFEGDRPIKLAVKSDYRQPDGYYRLTRIQVNAL